MCSVDLKNKCWKNHFVELPEQSHLQIIHIQGLKVVNQKTQSYQQKQVKRSHYKREQERTGSKIKLGIFKYSHNQKIRNFTLNNSYMEEVLWIQVDEYQLKWICKQNKNNSINRDFKIDQLRKERKIQKISRIIKRYKNYRIYVFYKSKQRLMRQMKEYEFGLNSVVSKLGEANIFNKNYNRMRGHQLLVLQ